MLSCLLFFFNDTATTEIYTLSLHDALPISLHRGGCGAGAGGHRVRRVLHRGEKGRHGHVRTRARGGGGTRGARGALGDRKSTRLNSSHLVISYAVFCLKKKSTTTWPTLTRP